MAVLFAPVLLLVSNSLRAELYFDREVTSITKKIELNQKSIKQLNKQLDLLKVAGREFENLPQKEKDLRIEQRNDILRQINTLKDKNEELSKTTNYFNAKKALFPSRYAGESCEIYYQKSPVEVRAIDSEFRNVLGAICKVLSPGVFNYPQRSTVVFLYSNQEDYLKYEINPDPLELPFLQSRYFCEYGGIQERSGRGMTLVLLISDEANALHQIRHDLVHLCLFKTFSPGKLWSKKSVLKADYVLDEGIAEYLVELLDAGASVPAKPKPLQAVNESDSTSMISETILSELEYTKAASPKVDERFAEASLFVRWLQSLEQGTGLFRQMIAADSKQYEYLLKSNQMARGVPQNGFTEYLSWRNAQFSSSNVSATP